MGRGRSRVTIDCHQPFVRHPSLTAGNRARREWECMRHRGRWVRPAVSEALGRTPAEPNVGCRTALPDFGQFFWTTGQGRTTVTGREICRPGQAGAPPAERLGDVGNWTAAARTFGGCRAPPGAEG